MYIMVAQSARYKIYAIRQDFIDGQTDSHLLAKKLSLSDTTINKYRKEFREIARLYPHKIHDFKFRLPKNKYIRPVDPRLREMITLLPLLIDNSTTLQIQLIPLWKDYRNVCTKGYSLSRFTLHYINWQRKTKACIYIHRRIKTITVEDRAILLRWKSSNKNNEWKRAVVLLGSYEKRNVHEMAAQVEHSVRTVMRWIDYYKEYRLVGIIPKPKGINDAIIERTKKKQENLIKLLHEPPSLHGLNRTSWRLEDLSQIFKKVYGESIAVTTISAHLEKMGFGFRKSREVLTSPDPLFREKLAHIKAILSALGENEKFFSVDEYGHFSVKMRGGTSIVKNGEQKTIPQLQRSKGFLVVTAALELSTNQVTHFYSRKKDTEEMIKLLELLLVKYRTQSKIYFSWDAASWHASKKLVEKIDEVNSDHYRDINHTPMVELAPLPASAQFLNVIESVFSGLAKAVIHNSNYSSLDDCMAAIDRHFKERNEHFLKNPTKAGYTIWGKERVKPVFDEANNCKYNNI